MDPARAHTIQPKGQVVREPVTGNNAIIIQTSCVGRAPRNSGWEKSRRLFDTDSGDGQVLIFCEYISIVFVLASEQ